MNKRAAQWVRERENLAWVIIWSTYIFIIAFNSTYFYLIVCYAHMKIFALYIRNISLIFIIIIIIIIIISGYANTENVFYSL